MLLEKNPKTRNIARQLARIEDKIFGKPFPSLKRPKQITVYHCGAAVLESLFSFVGVKVSQQQLVRSIRAQKKIVVYGLSVPEMAKAAKIAGKGKFTFWKKSYARVRDLHMIVNKYNYPLGVEWQGVFYEFEDEDNGHYSIVTAIDMEKEVVRISDPFHIFSGVDRKFKIDEFVRRWWDENDIKIGDSTRTRRIRDTRVLFVITPKDATWPKKLGMKKV